VQKEKEMKAAILTLAILLMACVCLAANLTPVDPEMTWVDPMATTPKCALTRVTDVWTNPYTFLYVIVCKDGSIIPVAIEPMTNRPHEGGEAHP
jgi:hypothetical protein